MKERLDVLITKQGFAESREKAKALIMSGDVFVNGQRFFSTSMWRILWTIMSNS